MALTDGDNGNMVMPVAPMYGGGYGNGGFGNMGGDWAWIILLLLLAGNGWGGGFGGMGVGGFAADGAMLYPWMNQAEITSDGFRDQMMNNNITSIRDGIFDISTQLCNGFAGVNAGVANGFAQAEIAANARQMADMNQRFALQSQLADCCCENRLGIANLGSDIAREACATRTNDTQNTQSILNVINGGIQSIKDQLCNDKIDAKNERIQELQQQLYMKDLAASQSAQTAAILANNAAQTAALEQYLNPAPIPAYVVQNPNCCAQQFNCGCGM